MSLFEKLKEIIRKKGERQNVQASKIDDSEDFETRDKSLRALRVEARRLIDSDEKEHLRKFIRDKRASESQKIFGMDGDHILNKGTFKMGKAKNNFCASKKKR